MSVFLGKCDGTFRPAVNLTATTTPYSFEFVAAVVAADFNGDGRADLAVTNQGSNNLTAMLAAANPLPNAGIDLPGGSIIGGVLTLTGWAIDATKAIAGVQVLVDGVPAGTATYGVARPDVCVAFPARPGCPNVGFTYQFDATSFNSGTHTVTVVATAVDAISESGSYSLTVRK